MTASERGPANAANADAAGRAAAIRDAAPSLLAYFVRRVGAPADAADLVGECIAAAWSSVKRMPADPEEARMWLFGVARNVLRHHYRAARRRDALVTRLAETIDPIGLAAADRTDGIGDGAEVRAAIAALPEDLAELVRLVYWDGFSLEQAASHLGVPASTLRSRHARAKRSLREALAGVRA